MAMAAATAAAAAGDVKNAAANKGTNVLWRITLLNFRHPVQVTVAIVAIATINHLHYTYYFGFH